MGGQPIYKSCGQTCVSTAAVVVRVHAPHLSHEETIRHFPPKNLHKISLPQGREMEEREMEGREMERGR